MAAEKYNLPKLKIMVEDSLCKNLKVPFCAASNNFFSGLTEAFKMLIFLYRPWALIDIFPTTISYSPKFLL